MQCEEGERERIARELAEWAREHAGTRFDLDPELEEAGLEVLRRLDDGERGDAAAGRMFDS